MSDADVEVTDATTPIIGTAQGAQPKSEDLPETDAPAGNRPAKGAAAPAADKAQPQSGTSAATLAAGGEAGKVPVTAAFPDNWRDILAGDDKKARKALDRFTDPTSLWQSYREADAKINSGDLVKVPGKRASAEEKQAFYKALGVPEQPAEYLEKIKLSKGRELGDDDKPAIESFAAAMHPHGATPAVVSAAADWWFDYQQAVQDQQAEQDHDFRIESEVELKRELGGSFASTTNAIGVLMSKLPPEVGDLWLNARGPDGRLLGDNPAIVKALGQIALDLYPDAGQKAPDGNTMRALEDEIAELKKLSSNDKSEYWEGPNAKKHQARFNELLEIRNKLKARAA